jgi:ABC-type Fe3+/spermidine/putrescine transport system ATPase subunit
LDYSEKPVTALLACSDIVCRLGARLALDGLTLETAVGESVALLGSSGSGKSTLLRVIAGLQDCQRGSVAIAGQPVTKNARLLVPPHGRGVAMLFQDLALWPNLTVAENVRLGLSGQRLSASELKQRIQESLESCGISELADRRPGTLSGGQQQRAALARALAMHPRLLLLDEPFSGLDLLTKETIVAQIARLKDQLGFSVVLVTHDPVEVQSLCQSVAVLEAGRIAERAPLGAMARRAQTALARAFARALAAGARADDSASATI